MVLVLDSGVGADAGQEQEDRGGQEHEQGRSRVEGAGQKQEEDMGRCLTGAG